MGTGSSLIRVLVEALLVAPVAKLWRSFHAPRDPVAQPGTVLSESSVMNVLAYLKSRDVSVCTSPRSSGLGLAAIVR